MAEGFELVRSSRQHLRRAGAFLEEGRFEDALKEVEAALELDAHDVAAQALRDRIQFARAGGSRSPIPLRRAEAPPAVQSPGFVPHGVNAASWRGFEQRITERRYKALLETVNTSIVVGDALAARAALDEARELKPQAPELPGFEARVAALPVPQPAPPAAASRVWMRAASAAAMFLVGVSLLMGLEWIRPNGAPAPAAVVSPGAPASVPAVVPDLGRPGLEVEESVPAVSTPPEPLAQPRGTTGTVIPLTGTRPVARAAEPPAEPPSPPASIEPEAASIEPEASVRTATVARAERAPELPPLTADVNDDFVPRRDIARAEAPSRVPPEEIVARAALTTPAAPAVAPSMAPPRAPEVDRPVTAENRGVMPDAAAAVTNAAAVTTAAAREPAEQTSIEQVLRRYARAYGDLNASAARAVWPKVDEKALARAFHGLASQDVSFDRCDIDIRGNVANASCRGQQSYTPKVGSREPRIEPRSWQFELRRDGDAWTIEGVNARRVTSSAAFDR